MLVSATTDAPFALAARHISTGTAFRPELDTTIRVSFSSMDGQIAWRTKGDHNNTEDRLLVTADKLVAVYEGTRLPGVGNVALFMQTTPGLIVCVVCPVLLLVGYDMVRRRMYEKSTKQDTDRLLAELEELRRMKAEKDQQEQ